MKKYVIVGNGTAAVGCIEGIRSVDKEGKITVISEEDHPVYSRPLISYLMEGKTDLQRMKYRGDGFYDENGCEVIYGKKALAIDKDKKEVSISGDISVPYDELCIATGSHSFVPPFTGLDKVEKKYGFMTLDDALVLREALTPESRVFIVGAGLIGLKCAEGINDLVKSITVCDLADRVLSSILDNECAKIVQKHLEDKGMTFLLGDSVTSFEKNSAEMKSGIKVDFDVLVLAVGVRANIGLVKDAGGSTNRGIVVDTYMKTDIPDVYAAGDCAEGFDSVLGANRVLAILPNAYMQGHTAGLNMAGKNVSYDTGMPMNSIGFFGLHIMSAGVYDGEMTEHRGENVLKRFFVKDGYLRGFILIGEIERAGIYTSLIREKVPLDTVDFGLMQNVASNLIFSGDIRRKKFGGVV